MTTVTLNGHTGVPSIVPMAQIKQYLPDGRFAGLRMKGPGLKEGKTLPFIPHFVDSRATLLDLRPESNKGCNEYLYAVKNTNPAAAANNNNELPAASADDKSPEPKQQQQQQNQEEQKKNKNVDDHFSPASQPRAESQEKKKSS